MEQNQKFYYYKGYSFIVMGLLSLLICVSQIFVCYQMYYYSNFMCCPYVCILMICAALVLGLFGLSSLLFWINHIHKRPYIVIEEGLLKIDAEMILKLEDILEYKVQKMFGCPMICLKINNEKDYKFSWRFKADRIFHKDYQAFLCPQLVRKDQQEEFCQFIEKNFKNKK